MALLKMRIASKRPDIHPFVCLFIPLNEANLQQHAVHAHAFAVSPRRLTKCRTTRWEMSSDKGPRSAASTLETREGDREERRRGERIEKNPVIPMSIDQHAFPTLRRGLLPVVREDERFPFLGHNERNVSRRRPPGRESGPSDIVISLSSWRV